MISWHEAKRENREIRRRAQAKANENAKRKKNSGRSTFEKLPGYLIDHCLSFLSFYDLCDGIVRTCTRMSRKSKALVDKHYHAEYMEERTIYDLYAQWYSVMSLHNRWYNDGYTFDVRAAISQICSEHSKHIYANLVDKDEVFLMPKYKEVLDQTCTYKTYKQVYQLVRDISIRRGDVIKAIFGRTTLTPCGVRLVRVMYRHFVVDAQRGFCYNSYDAFNSSVGVKNSEEHYKTKVVPFFEHNEHGNLTYQGFSDMVNNALWYLFNQRKHILGYQLIRFILITNFKV